MLLIAIFVEILIYLNHVVMCSMCTGSNCGNSKEDAIFEWNLRVKPPKGE